MHTLPTPFASMAESAFLEHGVGVCRRASFPTVRPVASFPCLTLAGFYLEHE